MPCDPNTLLEQAKCLLTCIPPGMMPAVEVSLLCQLAGGGSGGIFVLKAGDTMTGPLDIAPAVLVANDPALDIIQTWNNAGVTFAAFRISITNTNAAAASALIEGLVDGISRFNVRKNSTTTLHRQEADVSGATLQLSKRGTTGDATAPIANASSIAGIDIMGWDGATQATVAVLRLIAAEVFTNLAHGTQFTFGLAAVGATTVLTRMTLAADALNLLNGAAYQLNGVALHNPLSVYATGTVYTLTAVSAAVDFGTTDPIITVNAVGTYAIRAKIKVALNGATFAANRTLTVKLRRTNNTPADLANSSTTWIVPVVTTITNTLAVIELPEVLYPTALTTDTLQLFADISVVPTAGSISIDEASIVAVRLS
jgi:hypothetical protein